MNAVPSPVPGAPGAPGAPGSERKWGGGATQARRETAGQGLRFVLIVYMVAFTPFLLAIRKYGLDFRTESPVPYFLMII